MNRKIILSLVCLAVLALAGAAGVSHLRRPGPHEDVVQVGAMTLGITRTMIGESQDRLVIRVLRGRADERFRVEESQYDAYMYMYMPPPEAERDDVGHWSGTISRQSTVYITQLPGTQVVGVEIIDRFRLIEAPFAPVDTTSSPFGHRDDGAFSKLSIDVERCLRGHLGPEGAVPLYDVYRIAPKSQVRVAVRWRLLPGTSWFAPRGDYVGRQTSAIYTAHPERFISRS